MATRLYHHSECRDWHFSEAISDALFILDVEVQFLQVCGPLMMVVILRFSLHLHELQWLMINVDEYLLPKNVIS
jgi:hypothetical protein